MYLKEKTSGDMVEVVDMKALLDPCKTEFHGRFHSGEELQDVAVFHKENMTFPSGEGLPVCWTDPGYRG